LTINAGYHKNINIAISEKYGRILWCFHVKSGKMIEDAIIYSRVPTGNEALDFI